MSRAWRKLNRKVWIDQRRYYLLMIAVLIGIAVDFIFGACRRDELAAPFAHFSSSWFMWVEHKLFLGGKFLMFSFLRGIFLIPPPPPSLPHHTHTHTHKCSIFLLKDQKRNKKRITLQLQLHVDVCFLVYDWCMRIGTYTEFLSVHTHTHTHIRRFEWEKSKTLPGELKKKSPARRRVWLLRLVYILNT